MTSNIKITLDLHIQNINNKILKIILACTSCYKKSATNIRKNIEICYLLDYIYDNELTLGDVLKSLGNILYINIRISLMNIENHEMYFWVLITSIT